MCLAQSGSGLYRATLAATSAKVKSEPKALENHWTLPTVATPRRGCRRTAWTRVRTRKRRSPGRGAVSAPSCQSSVTLGAAQGEEVQADRGGPEGARGAEPARVVHDARDEGGTDRVEQRRIGGAGEHQLQIHRGELVVAVADGEGGAGVPGLVTKVQPRSCAGRAGRCPGARRRRTPCSGSRCRPLAFRRRRTARASVGMSRLSSAWYGVVGEHGDVRLARLARLLRGPRDRLGWEHQARAQVHPVQRPAPAVAVHEGQAVSWQRHRVQHHEGRVGDDGRWSRSRRRCATAWVRPSTSWSAMTRSGPSQRGE